MKNLIIATGLMVACLNAFAMSGGVDSNGKAYFEYHHTMKVNGKLLYCDKYNDCRTKKAWLKYMKNDEYKEEVVYKHEIGDPKAINNFTTQEIQVQQKNKDSSGAVSPLEKKLEGQLAEREAYQKLKMPEIKEEPKKEDSFGDTILKIIGVKSKN